MTEKVDQVKEDFLKRIRLKRQQHTENDKEQEKWNGTWAQMTREEQIAYQQAEFLKWRKDHPGDTPEQKAKRNRRCWTNDCNLEWFAWQCERIRSLLIDNLTCGKEGWTWKTTEDPVSGKEWYYRYKCIKYKLGERELVFHISAIARGYPATIVYIDIDRVGRIEHQCHAGEDNYDRNVMRIVEKTMIVVVAEFTGEDNQEYFPSSGELDKAKDRWVGDRFLD